MSAGSALPSSSEARLEVGGSGPAVASLFHRALSVIFLIAWVSLASQVQVLVGSHGLLPLGDFVAAARAENALSFATFPSLLAWMPGDVPLFWGTMLGVALAVLGLIGPRPRLCAALQTVWYLGYVTACRGFLGFQWDNLLLECGLLAAFLPAHRPAPVAHFMLRALLFKLYFESGLAKWQSPLNDWRDGSAMTFYYQTAPLPTALAWYAHHLPHGWHVFESYATLAMELVLPFSIFGPRRVRLIGAALFTFFQIINAATANYAFFCYLTLALHVFLLDDGDLHATRGWLLRHLLFPTKRLVLALVHRPISSRRRASAVPTAASPDPRHGAQSPTRHPPPVRPAVRPPVLAWIGGSAWIFVSLTVAWFHFGAPEDSPATTAALMPVLQWSQTFRLVNAFHLFAAVTRERMEPEFQTRDDGGVWTPRDLRYKPGDPSRAPRFVAPLQPRVDFLLWFYGLAYQRRPPAYVAALLGHLCEDPPAVAPLFATALPRGPTAVRVVFWDYRFTSAVERKTTGAWWSRRQLDATQPFACHPR